MINMFSGFSQLAYVTTDLEGAIAVFAGLGVPLWKRQGLISMPLENGGKIAFRFALTYAGPLQLEIIEPAGGMDDVYREFLPDHGFGLAFHHCAFKVPTPERLNEIRLEMEAANHPIAVAGGDINSAKFIYVDARDTFGHFLEYIFLTEERLALHEKLPRN
jgi:hypothetical protein